MFLTSLPHPWTVGRKTAAAMAPLLLEAVTAQGWDLDDDLIAELTKNPDGINSYRSVLAHRIADLPKRQTAATASIPPWCGSCGDENPAAAHNPRWRLTDGQPCPTCHPNPEGTR
ncbi:hypothetical protein ABZ772_24880 [Streptomyces griseoincarnatus]